MKFVAAALLLGGSMMATPALAADALSIETNLKFLEDNKKMKGVITRPSGLEFRIIQNGYGKRPQPTDTVKVYYTGKMINGVIFDGTSPGLPASFKLTSGLIQGWIEALLLMREGDQWVKRTSRSICAAVSSSTSRRYGGAHITGTEKPSWELSTSRST